MKIKQNNLLSYLAVTVGAGCVSSAANAAVIVVDLSGLSTEVGEKTLPGATGDSGVDFHISNTSINGMLYGGSDNGLGDFFGDVNGLTNKAYVARGYQGGASAAFPADSDRFVWWAYRSNTGGGFVVGENWVAFQDTSGNLGWMSFTLGSLGMNTTQPITSFGSFVYDPTSTSPANAISLQTAVAAAAVPEPTSLGLLALGAMGLATRRQRRKAA